MASNDDEQSKIFYSFLLTISILTTLVNITVLRMFTKYRKELLTRNTHNRILCSLCLADALVGMFGTVLAVLLLFKCSSESYKLAGNIPLFSCMFASVLSLAMLTADRLVAVKRPFMYGTPRYFRAVSRLIFATWCVPLYMTIQQAVIFFQLSRPTELQIRSLSFVTFFCIGWASLCLTNLLLYYSVRAYLKQRRVISGSTISTQAIFTVKYSSENPTESIEFVAKNPGRADTRKTNLVTENSDKVTFGNSDLATESSMKLRSQSTDLVIENSTKSEFRKKVLAIENIEKVAPTNTDPEMSSKCRAQDFVNWTRRTSKGNSALTSIARELRQTSVLCIAIVTSFLVLWTPLAVYRLFYAVGQGLNLAWLRRLCLCFTISNSLINPAIYFYFRRKIFMFFLKSFKSSLSRDRAVKDMTRPKK